MSDEKAAKKYRDALLSESLKLIKRLATQGVGLGKPAYADAQFFLANCLGSRNNNGAKIRSIQTGKPRTLCQCRPALAVVST